MLCGVYAIEQVLTKYSGFSLENYLTKSEQFAHIFIYAKNLPFKF